MAEVHIRDIPADTMALLKVQAAEKGLSQNAYIIHLLEQSALVGMPCLNRLLPETIQYSIRAILLSEASRTRAYTEAQLSLIRDNMAALDRCTDALMTVKEEKTR